MAADPLKFFYRDRLWCLTLLAILGYLAPK